MFGSCPGSLRFGGPDCSPAFCECYRLSLRVLSPIVDSVYRINPLDWSVRRWVEVARPKAAAKASATATLKRLAAENKDEFDKLVAELRQGNATDERMPAPPAAPGVSA